MIRSLVPLLCLLAACASPSAAYFGTPARQGQVNGREFQVYLHPERARAQVIRMGRAGGGEHQALIRDMVVAAERVSGCTALEGGRRGDSGVLNVALRCP